MIKSLNEIELDYSKSRFKKMSKYLKKEVDNGLDLTLGEIYYLLYRAGEKDVNPNDIKKDDDYDIYGGVTMYTKDNDSNPFVVDDVLGILSNLGIKEKVAYLNYSYPMLKEAVKQYLNNVTDVVVSSSCVSEDAFPLDKYFSATHSIELENINNDNKLNLDDVYDNALNISNELLEDLGFVSINDFTQYEYKIAYIYPNENGKKVIEYIKNLK